MARSDVEVIHCDIKTCVGCRTCEGACASHHFGAVSPALARIRVAKLEETGIGNGDRLPQLPRKAWLMECRQEGIISDADVDGMDLSWGSRQALLRLPEMIAQRQGIGDLLAEGTKRAAEKFGAKARKLTAEVKGLELFSADPCGIHLFIA